MQGFLGKIIFWAGCMGLLGAATATAQTNDVLDAIGGKILPQVVKTKTADTAQAPASAQDSVRLGEVPVTAGETGVSYRQTYEKMTDIVAVHLLDSMRYVCDPDGLISEVAKARMDARLRALEDSTSIQALVVIAKGKAENDCYEDAMALAEQYEVGVEKRDNGLVVVVETEPRCVQILTGYGIEGTLTDALSKRVITQEMLPYFKDNQWDEGMEAGVDRLCEILQDERWDGTQGDGTGGIMAMIIATIGGFMTLAWWTNRKKCPNCGKKSSPKRKEIKADEKGIFTRRHYVCPKCGTTFHNDVYKNTGGGGVFIGGGGGFGGGSRGGSYGGGRFGGGGAGGRF